MLRCIIMIVMGLCWGFTAVGENIDLSIDSVALRMDWQRYIYPQEKIHVTTNQGSYVAGDTIWFRAWVVDAASNTQVAVSRYVYVELISPFGSVDSRIKIKEHKGTYQGYIPIAEDLPEGCYTLSAYTGFMESAGADYFFRKPVDIISPYSAKSSMVTQFDENGNNLLMTVGLVDPTGLDMAYGNMTVKSRNGTESDRGHGKGRKGIRLNPKERQAGSVLVKIDNYAKYIPLPQTDDGLSVSFHPEGGYMVPGEASRIGIKAIDHSGRGVDVEGSIIDSNGMEVAQFTTLHRGMGETVMVPQADMTYTAVVGDQRFELPAPNAAAAVLRVDNRRPATVNVSAIGNVPDGASLVVQNRGRALYSAPVERGVQYRLPRERMGAGVVQFLLVDASGQPLSERLAFVAPDTLLTSQLKTEVVTDNDGRHRLKVDVPEHMAGADVAVSVIDRSLAEHDTSTDIRTQLLLQSDLRGHIEDPGYYFRNANRSTAAALDALLLTQGWSRYDVPQTLRNQYSEPSAYLEQGMEINGLVKSRWKGKPLAGAQINVLGPKIGYAGVARTDSDGRFTVSDVEWPEGVKFVVQALDKKGNNEHNFEIDPEHFPSIEPLTPTLPAMQSNQPDEDKYANAELMRRVSRINGRLNVALGEVTVRGRNTKKPEDIYEILAARTFRTEDIEKGHMTTYEELLRKIAGVTVIGSKVYYRREPVEFWVDDVRFGLSDIDVGGMAEANHKMRVSEKAALAAANGTSKSNLLPIQPADQTMNQWQNKPTVNLSHFESQYPFETIKRIDFIHPSMSAIFTSSRFAVFNFITKDGTENVHVNKWQYKIIEPLGYQNRKEFYNPKYEFKSGDDDMTGRSTLYWNPQININDLRNQPIVLPSANVAVLIEGLTPDGNIIR